MRANQFLHRIVPCLLLSTAMACLVFRGATAEVVSFSGTVSYTGSYAADTLYVAIMDTNTVGDEPTFITAGAFPLGLPPFDQAFELSFDNALATGPLVVAAALDVDGGGLQSIAGGDIVGWYGSAPDPALVSPTASHADIDFWLPLAEIKGTVTFGPDQISASVNASPDANCQGASFQPKLDMGSEGAYTILGLYPGTYCIRGEGQSASIGWISICYGDRFCASPTLVSVTTSQVVTGVDLDFSVITPNEETSWGTVKSSYR
jgi:hypothetical protein